MTATRKGIVRTSAPSITSDGKFFNFTIEFDDGKNQDVRISLGDIGEFVSFMVTAAARGCEMLDIEGPEAADASIPIEAPPLRGIGLAQAPDGQGAHLVLRLPGFWMSVAVEKTQMGEFAHQMASIARLLAPVGGEN